MKVTMKTKAALAACAALALVGVAAYAFQLMNGLGVTGMNNGTSWGLYIIMFMFFVGLSAGGLIVASSASVFNIKSFKKVALPAIILSTVCICCAGMFVLIDLGGVQRVWHMLLSPNLASPLLWDMCVITLYLAINVAYLFFMRRDGADSISVARVSRVALPVAILVHSVTAWIFGLQIAHEGWHSAILAPIFVASAMDSGLALLLVFLVALRKAGVVELGKDLLGRLAGLLATCIAVDAYFIGCEVLTMAYPEAGGADTLSIMLSGATSPFFWFEMVLGLAVPFCILVFRKNRERTGLVMGACALVVLGVFAKRVWLLLTSFSHFNLGSGVTTGTVVAQIDPIAMWATAGSYAPTVVEVAVSIGVVSVGALALALLSRAFLKRGK